ncbi:MAG: endolytic transglycosylase MltG [Leptospiraceae bacterium]|nr:endolytic transglycosylase MltG [Leptospiraceae bacterium]
MKNTTSSLLILLLSCIPCQHCQAAPAGEQLQFEVRSDERVQDWCERMEQNTRMEGACAQLDQIAQDRQMKRYAFLGPELLLRRRFEGMFRPGTYRFAANTDFHTVVLSLLDSAEQVYPRTDRYGLSPFQQLTLASIAEKEAVSNKQYDRVVRVFLNRLQKGQTLGSCPTVEYALGFHRPFLLFKDLEIQSPYNVYKRKGLPPTPIAFFSDQALNAVAQPADGDEVFFVYDWTTGQLEFSVEYGQHKRKAAIARQNFVQKYGRENMYRAFPDLYYSDIPVTESR